MPIISGGGGGGGTPTVLSTTTRLTDAQILALNATPVTIVSGAVGFVPIPLQVCVTVIEGGVSYGGAYVFRYFIGPDFASAGWGGGVAPWLNGGGVFNNAGSFLSNFAGDVAGGIEAFATDQEPTSLLTGQPLKCYTNAAVGGGDGTGSAILFTVYALAPVA